ncbi:hypothetical protein VTN49DRAFT_5749 [Thermomyces lanuginosus]|uniref:uncharacterized protein n=1 Tax=Thermomyces lanuginosus TaxID=5541 RepID=UPI003741E9D7
MASPASSTTTSSIQHDKDDNNTPTSSSPWADYPPIFVLPTHLTLDELHDIEDTLIERGAPLTYDATEACIFVGAITQRKRAALELRSRGLWTEEIVAVSSSGKEDDNEGMQPARKKQRLESPGPQPIVLTGEIKVVRLEWFQRWREDGVIPPLDAFLVYHGRVIPRRPGDVGTKRADHRSENKILERAMKDAAESAPVGRSSHSPYQGRRLGAQHRDFTQRASPPRLYRESTSEHDEPESSLPPAPDWVRENRVYACTRSAPLHPPNERFIEQLVKIRRVRELTLDEIGVRAYSTSIAALAAYPYELRSPREVLSLPGCDTKIANLFVEFKNSETGTLAAAEALDNDPVLRTLNTFYNIWGVGARTAQEFYHQHHWRDLDDLVEHGWDRLSRVQQIGVKYYEEFQRGVPRSEAVAIADTVLRHAHRVRPDADPEGAPDPSHGGIECILVGGYRRGKEVCGDIDLILTHRDEQVTKNLVVDVVASLEEEGWITHTLSLHMTMSNREQATLPYRGETAGEHHAFDTLDKAMVVWQDPHFDPGPENERRRKNPNPHRRVDIIISPWRTVGCAVLGWSGDTTFERDLRRYAKKVHGWKFDSSGVRERTSGGKIIDLERGGKTWEERERLVMEGLGVGWRPATERCTR